MLGPAAVVEQHKCTTLPDPLQPRAVFVRRVVERHERLPRGFYESASFGVSLHAASQNPYDYVYNSTEDLRELAAALRDALDPPPSRVLPWIASLGGDGDDHAVEGYIAQFDLEDLRRWRDRKRAERAGWSNALPPLEALTSGVTDDDWREAQRAVEDVARRLNQLLVVSWTPQHWGPLHHTDDLRHVHILQRTVPVRSGYQHLRDAGVVWAL